MKFSDLDWRDKIAASIMIGWASVVTVASLLPALLVYVLSKHINDVQEYFKKYLNLGEV